MNISEAFRKADQTLLGVGVFAINTIESRLPKPSQAEIRPAFARTLGYGALAGVTIASIKISHDLGIGLNPVKNVKILTDQVR